MYFFQTRGFKIGLTIAAAVAVILVVLFGRQITDWLRLFGSRAGVGEEVEFGAADWTAGTHTNTEVDADGNLTVRLPQ